MVDLNAPAEALGVGVGAQRNDHEFLDVDVGVRVGAAVEDVHQRNGQDVRVRAAEVAVERQRSGFGGCAGYGQGNAEDGVGAQAGLVLGSVQVDHGLVDGPLVCSIEPQQSGLDLVDHGFDGLQHALALVAVLFPVAALVGFEGAGGSTGGHSGPAEGVVVEQYLNLNGRVSARIEDLACVDGINDGHGNAPVHWNSGW